MVNKLSSGFIPQQKPKFWFILLIIAVGWSRYLPLSHPELFNFSPVLALFFVSGIFLKGHWSWIGPVCAVVLSDLTLNPFYGTNFLESFTLVSLLAYFGIFVIGKRIRRSPKMLPLLGGAVGSALLFHGLTCGFAWIANPAYMKTFSGFWQAQFLGEPGYAPAYLFLRNSIASTVLFSVLFSWVFTKSTEKENKPETSLQPSKIG